jgi:hypothetical protein
VKIAVKLILTAQNAQQELALAVKKDSELHKLKTNAKAVLNLKTVLNVTTQNALLAKVASALLKENVSPVLLRIVLPAMLLILVLFAKTNFIFTM